VIRDATEADADAIARIYAHYVAETIVTFEEEPVPAAEIRARMAKVRAAGLPWLVCTAEDRNDGAPGEAATAARPSPGPLVGYAYAARWHERAAYRTSVETTIYLDRDHVGGGLGRSLYGALLDRLGARGDLHAAIGGIALPNAASVGLHERLGFVKAAHYREVGFKQGRFIDVGYWQLLL